MHLNFTIKSRFFNLIDYWTWGDFPKQFRHGGQGNTEVNITSICKGNTMKLVSEWVRLGEVCQLLKPFAEQTDKLQSNCKSLSYDIPALMELEYHLLSCTIAKAVTKVMLDDLTSRFRCIRDPWSPDFMALPAARCLLDPSVASVLTTDDMKCLLEAAKEFILNEVSNQ